MTANGLRVYDFYIISDDCEWEKRILKKLQDKRYSGYYKDKHPLGGLKTESRLYGVKNSLVKIIGFPSPSKKTTDIDNYVASLAVELKTENDGVICVPIAEDSIIPQQYKPVDITYEETLNEDNLCNRIAEAIDRFKSRGSVRSSNTAEYTGDTDSSISVNQGLRRRQGVQHGGGDGHDETDIPAPANNIRGRGLQLMKWLTVAVLLIAYIFSDSHTFYSLSSFLPESVTNWLCVVIVDAIQSCIFICLLIYILRKVGVENVQGILLAIIICKGFIFVPWRNNSMVVHNFPSIWSFFKPLSIILGIAILVFVVALTIFVWYNEIISVYKSCSNEQIVAFIFIIFTIGLIMFGVIQITSPLLTFVYGLCISLFVPKKK